MKKMLRTFAILLAALVAGGGALPAAAQAPKGLQVPGGGTEAQPAGTVPWQLLQEARTMVEVVADNAVEFPYEPH